MPPLWEEGLGAGFDSRLMCCPRGFSYDAATHTGRLLMGEYECCDAAGCIETFKAIDPEVRHILTYAGDLPDMHYHGRGNNWIACEPDDVPPGEDPARDIPFDEDCQLIGRLHRVQHELLGVNDAPPNPGDDGEYRNREQRRFVLIPFDDIRMDTAPAYRIKGILPNFGLCIMWGPPKCGKSFLVFDMSMHVALGWKYRDRKVRQGSVVYCALEGCAPFKNRIEAFRQRHLVEQGNLFKHIGKVPFHLMASPMTLVADHLALIESIRVENPSPNIVVIDTLNCSLAGSESDDEDMGAYIKAADAIRDAFNCLVVIVHHCGHEGTRPRGHSSLMGALDAQLAVKRLEDDSIVATVELMKDGAQGDEWTSRLAVVDLGLDDDGDMITSCVVEAVEGASAPPWHKMLTGSAKIALEALVEALVEYGTPRQGSDHVPRDVKCVTKDQLRVQAYQRGICATDDEQSKRAAFRRGTTVLIAAKRVAVCCNDG